MHRSGGRAWREHLSALPALEALYLALAFLPVEDNEPELFVSELLQQLPLDTDVRAHLKAHHPGRLLIYRRLMRNNLKGVVETHIPRARARLGEGFDVMFNEFLSQRAPTSRFLRDVTVDFLEFWGQDTSRSPTYLHELARLEAVRIEVASAVATTHGVSVDLSLDVRLALAESVRLLEFKHAVHLLPDDEENRTIPARQQTYIVAYRDETSQVRYLNLSPLSFSVLSALHQGRSLGDAVTGGAAQAEAQLDSSTLMKLSELLGSLSERGIICGTLPAPETSG